jgi:hypothetical protein
MNSTPESPDRIGDNPDAARARFDELLAWYVNGTLDDAGRRWMESYLVEHPQARAETAWYGQLQQRMRDAGPDVAPTLGLDKVMARIRAERPSWSERVTEFLSSFLARPSLVPALSMAAVALLVIQGGVIFRMGGELDALRQETAEVRAGRTESVTDGPLLQVEFLSDARESQLRLLLIAIQGDIVGGPGQLGDYYIRVPAGTQAVAAERLKTQSVVRSVRLVPGLPPRQ